jgi:cell division protein FtsL
VLLLCGLLGGALVSALVISTTLAAGSFEISKLQNSTIAQSRQLQSLQEQVAQAQSAAQIANRATELGMRPVGELMFVDLKTGKLATDGTDWPGYVPPGYTP